jgi:hypothetical protein
MIWKQNRDGIVTMMHAKTIQNAAKTIQNVHGGGRITPAATASGLHLVR